MNENFSSIWGSPDDDPEVRGWTLEELQAQEAARVAQDAEKRKVARALLDEIDDYTNRASERNAEMKRIRQHLKKQFQIYVRITKNPDTKSLEAEPCDAQGHVVPDNHINPDARELINQLVFLDSASLRYNAALFDLVRLGLAHEGAIEGNIDISDALRFVEQKS